MKKNMVLMVLASLSLIFFIDFSHAEIPRKFHGNWTLGVNDHQGYPWQDQLKHPVKLEVSENEAVFIDQSGFRCKPKIFFYDEELDSVVFRHCLPPKSEMAFTPFYRAKAVGANLETEVWTFKLLFKLTGRRDRD